MKFGLKVLCILFGIIFYIYFSEVEASAHERIHFITLTKGGSDAIILESDGHFGMIDTGEDPLFPDGTDSRYPDRLGITKDPLKSLQDRLFIHLDKLGVKKLDFILVTHSHSDHIGNASDIMDKISVDKLFIKNYSDDKITDKDRLWDNLFGYDKAIESAKRNNVKIVQPIEDKDSNFNLGNMNIQLYNYKEDVDEEGNIIKYYDDNLNSILSVITVNGKKIFLGGDLQNNTGKEDYYGAIIGHVDFMKLNHHKFHEEPENTTRFLDMLSPSYAIATDSTAFKYKELDERNIILFKNSYVDRTAEVFDFNDEIKNISSYYGINGAKKIGDKLIFIDYSNKQFTEIGWLTNGFKYLYVNEEGYLEQGFKNINNFTYYFDTETGEMHTGWKSLDNKWYYLEKVNGNMKTGWQFINNKWYYLDKEDGSMKIGWQFINNKWYYLEKVNGDMKIGWQFINNKWYFLDRENGDMKTDWKTINGKWYYLDKKNGNMKTGWQFINNKWYYLEKVNGDMKIGWQFINNKWYYLDKKNGNMKTGWQKIDNKWYYLEASGEMRIKSIEYKGVIYKFNKSGETL